MFTDWTNDHPTGNITFHARSWAVREREIEIGIEIEIEVEIEICIRALPSSSSQPTACWVKGANHSIHHDTFSTSLSLSIIHHHPTVQIPNTLLSTLFQHTHTHTPRQPIQEPHTHTSTFHVTTTVTMFMKTTLTALFALAANQVVAQAQNATAADVALVEANMQRGSR
jgi:hypothetical protein